MFVILKFVDPWTILQAKSRDDWFYYKMTIYDKQIACHRKPTFMSRYFCQYFPKNTKTNHAQIQNVTYL